MVRVDGFFRVGQDFRLEGLNTFPEDFLITEAEVLEYSDITQEHDVDFAKRLTIDKGIASIPLSVFNDFGLDNKVLRFCFSKTDDTLKQAADILNII